MTNILSDVLEICIINSVMLFIVLSILGLIKGKGKLSSDLFQSNEFKQAVIKIKPYMLLVSAIISLIYVFMVMN